MGSLRATGKPFWEKAGCAGRIDLRIGPAADTLDELLASEGEGSIDVGFIDANKDQYGEYYEKLLRLLRPGGVIAVDNVIWDCRVLDANAQDKDTVVRHCTFSNPTLQLSVNASNVPLASS